MGWLFNLLNGEPKIWELKTIDDNTLFEGTQSECKNYYKNNIYFLYVTRKLKYIFKYNSKTGNKYKIDLGAIYEDYKKDLF